MATRVEFSTRKFELSHMTKPRGRGSWAFELAERPDDIVWAPGSLTITEAKTWMREYVLDMQAEGAIPDHVDHVIVNVLP